MAVRFAFALAAIVMSLALAPRPAAAQAPDPEALAAANELTKLIVATGYQDAMIKQGWPPIEATIRKSAPQIADDKIEALRAEFASAVNDEMADVLKGVPELYAKYFTGAELKDILAFYQTPTGQKTLTVLPQLSGETMKTIMGRMPAMQTRLKERFMRVLQQQGVMQQKL